LRRRVGEGKAGRGREKYRMQIAVRKGAYDILPWILPWNLYLKGRMLE